MLHLRVSLLQLFTADIAYLLLASLVMGSRGVHIFYSQWSCPSLSSKGYLMIWTQSFFCLSPIDTGLWGVFLFCFYFFYSFFPTALDLPLCPECCSFFPKRLKALFCSGPKVETSGTGFCSFPKVTTVHFPRPPPWGKPSLVSCSPPSLSWTVRSVRKSLLRGANSSCVLLPKVLCSQCSSTLMLVHTSSLLTIVAACLPGTQHLPQVSKHSCFMSVWKYLSSFEF